MFQKSDCSGTKYSLFIPTLTNSRFYRVGYMSLVCDDANMEASHIGNLPGCKCEQHDVKVGQS